MLQGQLSNHLLLQCTPSRFLGILLLLNISVAIWKEQMLESAWMCSPSLGRRTFYMANSYRRAIWILVYGCCFPHVSCLRHPILWLLVSRELASQNFQQLVRPCWWILAKKLWTVRSRNHQIVRVANSTIDNVASHWRFSIRLVPPVQQIADACVQRKPAVSMGCTAASMGCTGEIRS